ncbi:hypothetical protein F8M41_000542 [Gigaspora margarita]|uniref:Uncharacterized protein n=1 Tax=Gigaspora margarita TaxID=4874 RepID=A0A8H3XHT5_GIGMA|nr:hypothetical protein F8M41_000542 [Gigaspora margarita]
MEVSLPPSIETRGDLEKSSFYPKFAKTQSEGTYVADIIVPIIRAKLKICQLENLRTLAKRNGRVWPARTEGEREESVQTLCS